MEYTNDAAAPKLEFAVRCRGITKTYGTGDASAIALRGIDLEVYRGELLMLVGPSGCGKTTLISVIAAILDQNSGDCEVFGQNLQRMSRNERTRFRGESIGFVFQLFNLLPALNSIENVAIPLLINGISPKESEARAIAALEQVQLEDHLDSLPGQLSGGQQQRVAIARALSMDPICMLFDEPTSALDPEMINEVLDVMVALAKDGMTMMVVTHEMGFANKVANRVIFMDSGRIVEDAAKADFFGKPRSERAQQFLAKILHH
jgi:ABC-type polar amino acid transport system ATPase subunit